MLSQDHTNDALGLLKKFVEDIGKNICSPVEHWKMTLAIIERLEDMGRDIENAIELKKKEDAHVQ